MALTQVVGNARVLKTQLNLLHFYDPIVNKYKSSTHTQTQWKQTIAWRWPYDGTGACDKATVQQPERQPTSNEHTHTHTHARTQQIEPPDTAR